jgi:predicted Zn-dependent peptidase
MKTFQYKHDGTTITHTTLDSGMVVLTGLRRSRSVSVRFVLPYGRLDDDGQHEVHHLLEHVLYSGPAREYGNHPALRELMLQGVVGNASTGDDFTDYYLLGALEHVQDMMTALRQVVFDGDITSTVVDSERATVLREMSDSSQDVLYRERRWNYAHVYPHIGEAQFPEVSVMERALQSISPNDLSKRYAREYRTGNAAMIVVGDVDHKDIVSWTELNIPQQQQTYSPSQRGRCYDPRFGTATLLSRDQPESIQLYFPAPQPGDEEWKAALEVAFDILSDDPFGMLYQKLRVKDRLVYGIDPSLCQRPFSSASLRIEVPREHFIYVEDTIVEYLRRVANQDIDSDAFQAALASRLRYLRMRDEEPVETWSERIRNSWIDREEQDFDVVGYVQSLTPAVVANAVDRIIRQQKCGALMVVHEKEDDEVHDRE